MSIDHEAWAILKHLAEARETGDWSIDFLVNETRKLLEVKKRAEESNAPITRRDLFRQIWQ